MERWGIHRIRRTERKNQKKKEEEDKREDQEEGKAGDSACGQNDLPGTSGKGKDTRVHLIHVLCDQFLLRDKNDLGQILTLLCFKSHHIIITLQISKTRKYHLLQLSYYYQEECRKNTSFEVFL